MVSNVLTLAWRELRDSLRARSFLLYSLAFLALGLGVSYVSAAGTGSLGLSGFGRTTAGLINIVLLVVPLMALSTGASAIAGDRERGMLLFLLAQPVSRLEVLLGKYIGLAGALIACVTLGLGACSLVLAWQGGTTEPRTMLWLAGLSILLALSMLSLGMLVSALARKASVAVGTAVFLWLALVFVTDLGIMAGTLALRLPVKTLFVLTLSNPLQAFKMWALHSIDASIDVLGPAGLYAMDTYNDLLPWMFGASMVAWIALPLVATAFFFRMRSPV
ncbi:MAG: ABC transporter permease [Phycisphaerales bacterium]|nr:ABC transporter permease [Phycisphaerales bacterium]